MAVLIEIEIMVCTFMQLIKTGFVFTCVQIATHTQKNQIIESKNDWLELDMPARGSPYSLI